ncbi:hypothetical protein BT93_D1274 [Corymbia citriodora subsp. variegata]|nr:hypothetical protein BT93_D1274 [Corymbia citriodora subsp. variegata]
MNPNEVPKIISTCSLLQDPVLAIGEWCVPTDGVPDPQLQANVDFACSHGANCIPIQPGQPCFLPNTPWSHASYAMNAYFQTHGRTLEACSFGGTGMITNRDPSKPSSLSLQILKISAFLYLS